MLDDLIKLSQTTSTLEDIFHNTDKYLKSNLPNFQTMSIFIDRGNPTFRYTANNRKVLLNLSVPWQSIAGVCMRQNEQILAGPDSKLTYLRPAQITGYDIKYIQAQPLHFLNHTFGCFEFLTKAKPTEVEQKLFCDLANYLNPIIYLNEWYDTARRTTHAIKNKAFIGTMTLHCVDMDAKKREEVLMESFEDTSSLCEDFIKFTAIKFDLQNYDVNEILLNTIAKLSKMAKLNKFKVKITKDLSSNLMVRCDENAIREEVLYNILKNIWEEWEQKQQKAREIAFKTYQKDKFITVEITDNAGGIHPAIAEKLFSASKSTKGAGRGIGMSVAHHIMRYHDGELDFTTEQEKGTTFIIKFPIKK